MSTFDNLDGELPTAADFIRLCAELGITLAVIDGVAVVSAQPTDVDLAESIEGLLQREPWRTQIIELIAAQDRNKN